MPRQLKISLGQHSDRGLKEINQDFHGACIPQGSGSLSSKGIAVALADGISSSPVSRIASEAAVKGFLEDYFSTPASWSVRRSAQQVLMAVNSWLHAQTRQGQNRYDRDRGYVCTLSVMVLKSATAHVFHVGDARVYRFRDGAMEQLTEDHRMWVSQDKSYLTRAFGANPQVEIDYRAVSVEPGDVFVLATDGVHEYLSPRFVIDNIEKHRDDLQAAAQSLVRIAHDRGSADNLTAQIVRVDEISEPEASELHQQGEELPCPPPLAPGTELDGYKIVREIHASHRSHVYLAVDSATGAAVAIKTPSVDLQADAAYRERFLLEDWTAQRIDDPHVVRGCAPSSKRTYLYTVTQFVAGQTLAKWMLDNPAPSTETVRDIVVQIAKGVRAFHRLEILHQDLRPENIVIDATGTVKIVDFGSVRVAGIAESQEATERIELAGTAQYMAPEYFLGAPGTTRSDLFSLGVIAYQMLSGRLPYGAEIAKSRTQAAQRTLEYRSVLDAGREIPAWIDQVLRKATHPNPRERYEELSEFVHDLHHPNDAAPSETGAPLIERNPLRFWQIVAAILAALVLGLLLRR